MDAECETVAGGIDLRQDVIEFVGLIADHVQNRPENFTTELRQAAYFIRARREETAVCTVVGKRNGFDQPGFLVHALGMRHQNGFGVFINDRTDVGAEQARIADTEFVHFSGQQFDDAIGDVALHEQNARSRAALSGRIEGRHQGIVHQLFRQGRGVGNQRVLAAGFGDQRSQWRIARRQCAVDGPGCFGRAGKHHAGDARIAGQGCTHSGAVAGQELQNFGWHAGVMQDLHREIGGQGRLFGRLGDHGVAGGERGGDLAEENGQREIPGADAHEHAATVQLQFIGFAGRARQGFRRTEMPARLHRIVTGEIDRFADLRDRGGHRLSGFLDAQRDDFRHTLFHQVGCVLENFGACGGRGVVPARIGGVGDVERLRNLRGIGGLPAADDLATVSRIADIGEHCAGRGARNQRRGLPGFDRGGDIGGQTA